MERPAKKKKSSQMLMPQYFLEKTLGIGAFGKVKLARHIPTGLKVAIKILNLQKLNASNAEKVRREVKILAAFSHPHIVRLYEVIEIRSKVYVVMEYMDSGDLFCHITVRGRIKDDEARYIFQQIISGVDFCHLNMVAHRDLKPENLLLDSNGTVKLADFGLSNMMVDGHFLKTTCGSPEYAAPEIISNQLYAGPEVDVWSCGVVLYALLCGRLPFEAENLSYLCSKIKSGIYTLPGHLSIEAKDLISRILVVDPVARITIPEIRQHPWFCLHLPWFLSVHAEEIKERSKLINKDTFEETVGCGFSHNFLMESLQNKLQNEATVTYYLLLDKRLRASSPFIRYGFNNEKEIETAKRHLRKSTSTNFNNSMQQQMRVSPRSNLPCQRNWTIGLQTLTHPHKLMLDALSALQRLNVSWKRIGCYNMKCRWLPNFSRTPGHRLPLDMNSIPVDEPSPQNAVKFEMQLYKAPENRYLLDLQRVSGPPLLFLEICASFLSQIRVL
ncbi:hypothetical protein J5N97_018088 [Dioscorea zingiberensis]|uniref:non-specific serine/threonine protein kinase n=1 Tax=Dioscorea zingiberensis TaxID=325984 RepID=A0A9D5CM81_9LILI|nr:hypothetical protein J5N97_018088 [Dioscorea zingiberensis]